MKKLRLFLPLIAILLAALACNFPGQAVVQPTEDIPPLGADHNGLVQDGCRPAAHQHTAAIPQPHQHFAARGDQHPTAAAPAAQRHLAARARPTASAAAHGYQTAPNRHAGAGSPRRTRGSRLYEPRSEP